MKHLNNSNSRLYVRREGDSHPIRVVRCFETYERVFGKFYPVYSYHWDSGGHQCMSEQKFFELYKPEQTVEIDFSAIPEADKKALFLFAYQPAYDDFQDFLKEFDERGNFSKLNPDTLYILNTFNNRELKVGYVVSLENSKNDTYVGVEKLYSRTELRSSKLLKDKWYERYCTTGIRHETYVYSLSVSQHHCIVRTKDTDSSDESGGSGGNRKEST